jgi:hypothetical protein
MRREIDPTSEKREKRKKKKKKKKKRKKKSDQRFFPSKNLQNIRKICFSDMFPAPKCRVQDVLRHNDCTTVSSAGKLDISTENS